MRTLLGFSRRVDAVSAAIGRIAEYLVLACCLISAANALIRYSFNQSSNGWLEIQWYLFAFIVLLGASHTLRKNEHVRVDLVYGAVSERARLWIDTVGLVLFLLPATVFLTYLCWPYFLASFRSGEMSSNAGGLIRWPVHLILVTGFALLTLQGISELIKRVAALKGAATIDTTYEKPLQ